MINGANTDNQKDSNKRKIEETLKTRETADSTKIVKKKKNEPINEVTSTPSLFWGIPTLLKNSLQYYNPFKFSTQKEDKETEEPSPKETIVEIFVENKTEESVSKEQEGHADSKDKRVNLDLIREPEPISPYFVDENGKSALYLTVYHLNGIQDKMAAALVAEGANYECLGDEATILLMAIDQNAWSFLNALLKRGLDINHRDFSRRTLLHHAAKEGRIDRVKALIGLGANTDLKDENNVTALHLGAQKGHDNVVRALVRSDCQLNVIDNLGRTPLYLAVSNGHTGTAKILIQAKANVNIADSKGVSPLSLSLEKHDFVTANALLDAGICAEHVKKLSGPMDLMLKLVRFGEFDLLKKLTAKGLNSHATDSEKANLLHKVMRARPRNLPINSPPVVRNLIACGIDGKAKDKNDSTPLHYAANRVDAEELLNHGIPLETKNKHGWTPLLNAAYNSNPDLVDFYLARGAYPYHVDVEQHNIIHLARVNGDKPFVKELKKKISISDDQLNEITTFLTDLFTACYKQALAQNKKVIFALGEAHGEFRGVQVEKIALKVAKSLGINLFFDELKLMDCLILSQNNPSRMILKSAKKHGFTCIGVDNGRSSNILSDISTEGMRIRNSHISADIEKCTNHGVLATGAAHLQGLLQEPRTEINRDKFFVVPLCLAFASDFPLYSHDYSKVIQLSENGFDRKQAEAVINRWNNVSIDLTSKKKSYSL